MMDRKLLVHFLKVPTNINDFASKIGTVQEADIEYTWVRIGQHLEAFAEELNPQVDYRKNIWGYQSAIHNGYQVSSAVDTFYATKNQSDNDYYLYQYVEAIALNRWQGDQCKTERVDAMVEVDIAESNVEVVWAWKEDCFITPQSVGGDTSGVQIPFQIGNLSNRVDVTNNVTFSRKQMTLVAS